MEWENRDSFFFSLGGGTSTDVLTCVCWLCPACVGFMEKTGAMGSGPQDGCTWHPNMHRAKCLAKHTHYPLLEEQAASRKLFPCLRLFWPIQYNWTNNFLLNADGKSPISCPNQQGMSVIVFAVRGASFQLALLSGHGSEHGGGRKWGRWAVEVRGSFWNVHQGSFVEVKFCKNLVKIIAWKSWFISLGLWYQWHWC